ncbi:hypothetical protein GCM10009744_64950 [Kribbella alba]|uniref:Restriction endonuclease type IV Mrr domain-containing protein n=1 Tax=Kribbella alba TaxID=190197 RepID=A0ABN2FYK5_9ACTN
MAPRLNDEQDQIPGAPLWKRYELSVRELLAALDPAATVVHNQKIPGRLSGCPRQVDVWAIGTVVGLEISVAVECKRRRRAVDVEIVDQFIGKLLDLGASHGVLYSHSGFTSNAAARASSAQNPCVMVVATETPEIVTGLQGVPGYPADLLVEDVAPAWIEELRSEKFAHWLATGEWPKWWT